MKTITLIIHLVLCTTSMFAQVKPLMLAPPDVSVQIAKASFSDSPVLGEVPCISELHIFLEIHPEKYANLNRELAIPISGKHYVDGKLSSELDIYKNSTVVTGVLHDTPGGSPFYSKTHPNSLLRSTEKRPILKPEAIGVDPDEEWKIEWDKLKLTYKKIRIKVPFEVSSEFGIRKFNKYVFEIGSEVYQVNGLLVKKLIDTKIVDNMTEQIYSKRCIKETNFSTAAPDEGNPPIIWEDYSKNIAVKVFPSPVVIKGQLITVDIDPKIETPREVKFNVKGAEVGNLKIQFSPAQLFPNGHQFLISSDDFKEDGIYILTFTHPSRKSQTLRIQIKTKTL